MNRGLSNIGETCTHHLFHAVGRKANTFAHGRAYKRSWYYKWYNNGYPLKQMNQSEISFWMSMFMWFTGCSLYTFMSPEIVTKRYTDKLVCFDDAFFSPREVTVQPYLWLDPSFVIYMFRLQHTLITTTLGLILPKLSSGWPWAFLVEA